MVRILSLAATHLAVDPLIGPFFSDIAFFMSILEIKMMHLGGISSQRMTRAIAHR